MIPPKTPPTIGPTLLLFFTIPVTFGLDSVVGNFGTLIDDRLPKTRVAVEVTKTDVAAALVDVCEDDEFDVMLDDEVLTACIVKIPEISD